MWPLEHNSVAHGEVGLNLQVQGKKDGEPDNKEDRTQRGRGESTFLPDGECQFHQQDSLLLLFSA